MLQFNEMGLLTPTKAIETNIAEFRATFVFNERRETLFSTYLTFLEELENLEITQYFQYIDGSFTTKKTFPNDIDVVSFVDFRTYRLKKTRLLALKGHYKSKGIDAYFVEYYPESHPLSPTNQYQINDWFDVYGATKPIGQQRKIFKKGFLLINFS